ncbi:pilus assembly protein CpaB [Clostridia bacterium]|nr:pilus assembly protein CpaB [Clostridia bacterium]
MKKPKLQLPNFSKLAKNRFVIGGVCFVLALILCFVVAPLLSQTRDATADVVRVKAELRSGDMITDADVEVVTVGAYNLNAAALRDKSEVVGKYAITELLVGDYITNKKLSDTSPDKHLYLKNIEDGKLAISVTLKSYASGLSGKLMPDDIVSVLDSGSDDTLTVISPYLQYLKVLAVTRADGLDNTEPLIEDNTTGSKEETVVLLCNPEQAKVLALLEASGGIHIALAYRGDNGAALLKAQDEYIASNELPPVVPNIPNGENKRRLLSR